MQEYFINKYLNVTMTPVTLKTLIFSSNQKRTKKKNTTEKRNGHGMIIKHTSRSNIADFFRATIGGKFAPLLALENQDTKTDALIRSFFTAVTETANTILGKHRPAKKPWVTDNILKMCDKRRELKQKKVQNFKEKRTSMLKKGMRKAQETWIEEQCQGIEENLQKPNSKKAYHLVKELTGSKQGRTTTIQDKAGKCLTEEDILKRWTEYCSESYTHTTTGDPKVLDFPPPINNDRYPILREEIEAAVK